MAYLENKRIRVRYGTAAAAACMLLTTVELAQAQAPATSAPAVSASVTVAAPPPPAASVELSAPAVSAPPVETAPAVSAVPEPPPPPPVVPETPPQTEVPPELVPEEPPPVNEPEPTKSSLSLGVAMRTGLGVGLSGPGEGTIAVNDGLFLGGPFDQVQVRPNLAGTINDHIGFFTQFEFGAGTASSLGVSLLDAIAQIKVVDEFQIWLGQHIPANDRNNNNGPFFANTWNFAVDAGGFPFDAAARDRGVTFWGLIAGGRLKYHASMVDLHPGQKFATARYAGRLTLHLLEPEAFYYNSGTYWGTKDVLAIGAMAQGQQGPEGTPNTDFAGFSFDAFFEKNTGGSGTITIEGAYWNFESTESAYVNNQGTGDSGAGVPGGPYGGSAYMGVLSWLTPDKVGPGQIQPNFRIQYADGVASDAMTLDLGVAYVIDGFNHKYHLNYRHKNVDPDAGGGVSEDMLQLGVQYMLSL